MDNIWVKRPGREILAERFDELLGKIAVRDIENDQQLKSEDID
jgi:N-acetylneuraminate synthase